MNRHGIHWTDLSVKALLLPVVLAGSSAQAWAQVGYVHALSGSAAFHKGSARPVPIKVGDTFEVGTVFATAGDSRLTLKLADGQVLVLSPNSRAEVKQCRFDTRNVKASNLTIGLEDGALRFVGGAIAKQNREAVQIAAGKSTVSILRAGGVDFTVALGTNRQGADVAAVTLGEVGVRTPHGPIIRIEAGQAVPWRAGSTPPPPIPITATPAVIQAELAGLQSIKLPDTTPVVVGTAAGAAVASVRQQPPGPTAKGRPAHAGYVHALSGSVVAQGPSGRPAPVSVGDAFVAGILFNTAENGRVVLKFADGQVVVVGPTSIARVGHFRFDERIRRSNNIGVELLNGSMRLVGGAIAADNREGVRVIAGGSTVQILSTGPLDFSLVVDTRAQEIGVVAVVSGEVAVRTPYGRIRSVRPDQVASWMPGRTPAPPVLLSQAPTLVAGQLEALRAAIGAASLPKPTTTVTAEIAALLAAATPDDTPVAVDAAAAAAAAAAVAGRARAAAAADPRNIQLQAAAQAAEDVAASAAKAAADAAESLIAALLEVRLAALPATATGPGTTAIFRPIAPPGPTLADLTASPIVPLTITPGGGGRCVGSPC